MGIADYGVGPNGPYQYRTNESLGQVYVASLQTKNATGDPYMSFQVNVVLEFSSNNAPRVYWIQDVAQIDTSTDNAYFLDNVWNFSSRTATMSANAISGAGQVSTYQNGRNYYYDRANLNGIILALPASISFLVTTQVNPSGQPAVSFEYSIGSGFQTYDSVSFVVTNKVTSFSGFVVDGIDYNPYGTFYDSELVMAGACCGYNVTDISSDVRLSLYYENGHNYETVPNAYNFGSDTAEGASNVNTAGFYVRSTGTLYSEITPGGGSLGKLYDRTQTGTIDVHVPVSSGVLYVSNATSLAAIPAQYAFIAGEVRVNLYPGKYLLQIYQNGALYDQGTEALAAGQNLILQTPLGDIQITMSFAVVGGGSGFVPVLTYTHAGAQIIATLTPAPIVYYMDPGTTWRVTGNQTGANERWATVQPTSGIAASFKTIQETYYHQYVVNLTYSIRGGIAANAGPTAQYVQFGSPKSTGVGALVWVDGGSSYTLTNPLLGSTSTERWYSNEATNSVAGPGKITIVYYLQFTVSVSYSIAGGGNPAPPSATGTEFGSPFSIQLGPTSGTVWFDKGTNWSFMNPLGGGSPGERWSAIGTPSGSMVGAVSVNVIFYHQYAINTSSSIVGGGNPTTPLFSARQYGSNFSVTFASAITNFLDAGSNWSVPQKLGGSIAVERWATNETTMGQIMGPLSISLTYYHQFYLRTGFGPAQGGSITNATGWHDAGSAIQLSAFPSKGWKFEGWVGGYSGPINQTSIKVNSPVIENATFYPGLMIMSDSNGQVSYSYLTNSGTIEAGTSMTVYAPVGTVITLQASPSSLLYQFGSWSPASVRNSGQTTLKLESPSSIQAKFSLNSTTIGVILIVVIAVTAASVLVLRRRSSRKD